jgi:hypothetical protein
MARRKTVADPDDLRQILERKESLMEATRLAYLHRTPINGKVPDYGALRQAALEFIEANYTLQRALFGKVRVKLSVASLLR